MGGNVGGVKSKSILSVFLVLCETSLLHTSAIMMSCLMMGPESTERNLWSETMKQTI